ncbi:hypothetical protein IRB23SM22_22000 [Alkalibacterium sp. s-m-22]
MLIHTTDKFMSEIEKAKGHVLPLNPTNPNENAWLVHIAILNRRKALVLVHLETQLTLVAWPLKKEELSKIENIIHYVRQAYFDYLGLNWVKQMEIEKKFDNRDLVWTKGENIDTPDYLEEVIRPLRMEVRGFDDEEIVQLKLMEKVNNRLVTYTDGTEDTPLNKWESFLSDKGLGENLVFTPPVAELKVSLELETEEDVVRVLQVPMTYTFNQLHHILQKAFMWDDYHLHQFTFEKPNGMSVCLVDDDESFGYKQRQQIMKYDEEVQLLEYIRSGDVFLYEYDFGDDWRHRIEVTQIIEKQSLRKARLIDMQGDPVPEDVGGVDGYAEFKQVMSDPSDEQYEHFSMWSERFRSRLSIHTLNSINFSLDRL